MERPRNLGESGRDDRPERDFRSGVQLLDALELSGTRLFPLEATGIKSLDFARHRWQKINISIFRSICLSVFGMSFCMPRLPELLMQSAKRAAVLDERRVAARHTVDRYATVRRMPSGDT